MISVLLGDLMLHFIAVICCRLSVDSEVFCKKGVLRNFAKFTEKHMYQSFFFNKVALAQMFSCEFGEISKHI